MPKCRSCGETFRPEQDRDWTLTDDEWRRLVEARKTTCEDCAREVALGELLRTTTIHGTGGGQRVIRDPRGLG